MRHPRAAVASVLAASLALVIQPVGIRDWPMLEAATNRLLDGGFAGAYSYGGFLQGPLSLVVGLLFHPVSHAEQVWAVLAGLALGPLLLLTRREITWTLALLPVLPWAAFAASGHPDDLGAIALMLVACHRLAGPALAVAAAFKPWAVAGVGALRSVKAWVVFVVGSVVLWLPYLLAHPATQGQWNPVQSASPMHLLVDGVLPEWVRPVQLVLVAAVGLIAAQHVPLERAMLAALAVRVMTEPGDFDYYFGPLALLGAATGSRRVTAVVVLAWMAKGSPWPAATRLVLLVAVVVAALALRPATTRQAHPVQPLLASAGR